MEMDTSAPPTPVEPVLIDAGPEVDQFAKLLDSCLSSKGEPEEKRQKLLDLPRKYHEITVKRLRKLQPRSRQNGDVDMMNEDEDDVGSSQEEAQECERLSKEAQTWDLLSRVLPLRHSKPLEGDSEAQRFRLEQAADQNDRSILGPFFRRNPVAKERRAVLQWLQTNAANGPSIDDLAQELQKNADRGEIMAHGWVHTRSAIKLKKSVTGWPHLLDRQQSAKTMETHKTSNASPMITQLDPDACSRQGRQLQPQDAYFEQALWLGCFEHLRRGSSLTEIRDWCSERTETWRAISMSGMLLSTNDEDVADCTSPASLALWRRMCYALAHKGTSDAREAAVYGLLSGDISTVEKVAKTWEDFVFTHYNALLRAQIDTYILERCPPAEAAHMVQSFPSFNAVQSDEDGDHVERKILHSLSLKEGAKKELLDPNKALHSAILSRTVDEYFLQQGRVLSTLSTAPHNGGYVQAEQYDGLRIVAHVYALATLLEGFDLRYASVVPLPKDSKRRETEGNIISQYASFLRQASLEELIPTYCALLQAPQRYDVLSANLILEEDVERRQTLLTLMEKTGIDLVEFVEAQAGHYYDQVVESQLKEENDAAVFRCLGDGSSSARVGRGMKADFFGEDEDDIEPNHAHLVRSIEWLQLVPATWPSVFAWMTAAYKTFLSEYCHFLTGIITSNSATGNVDLRSARLLMKTISFSSVLHDCLGLNYDEDCAYDLAFWSLQLDTIEDHDTTPQQVMEHARSFRELEALVIALDNLESISAFAEFATEIADK